MYLYVELWKPRDEWHALPASKRQEFADGIGPALSAFTEAGIELIGFSLNDSDTGNRADYTYFAAWRMPSKDLALQLEHAVADYGFFTYFDQVNARGEIVAPEAVLKHMAQG